MWFSKLDTLPDSGNRGGTGGEISRSGTENSGWLVGWWWWSTGEKGRRGTFFALRIFFGVRRPLGSCVSCVVVLNEDNTKPDEVVRTSGEEVGADSPWQRGVVGRFVRRGGRRPGGLLRVGRSPGPRMRNQQKSPNKTNPQQKRREVEATIYWIIQSPNKVLSPSVHVSPHALSRNHASVSDAQECHFHRLIFETSHDCARNHQLKGIKVLINMPTKLSITRPNQSSPTNKCPPNRPGFAGF